MRLSLPAKLFWTYFCARQNLGGSFTARQTKSVATPALEHHVPLVWSSKGLNPGKGWFTKCTPYCLCIFMARDHGKDCASSTTKLVKSGWMNHFVRKNWQWLVYKWVSRILLLVKFVTSLLASLTGGQIIVPWMGSFEGPILSGPNLTSLT